MMNETISMTMAKKIVAQQSNPVKRPQELNNKDVFSSGLFEPISGPGSEAPEYSTEWKLTVKQ